MKAWEHLSLARCCFPPRGTVTSLATGGGLSCYQRHRADRKEAVVLTYRARLATRISRAFLIAAASGVLLLPVAADAKPRISLQSDSAVSAIRTYKNLATGFCLDSNARRQVYTLGCNGGSYQKWVATGTKIVTLKNLATGFCLDSNARRQVYTLRCNGGSYQKWVVSYKSPNQSRVFKNLATGFVLDSNAARRVYTFPENGGSYQKWRAR